MKGCHVSWCLHFSLMMYGLWVRKKNIEEKESGTLCDTHTWPRSAYSKQLNCDLFHSKKKSFLVLFFFLFLRTKLTEREVLGSLMEQLMINTGESELEVQYKIASCPMNSQSGRQRRTIICLWSLGNYVFVELSRPPQHAVSASMVQGGE